MVGSVGGTATPVLEPLSQPSHLSSSQICFLPLASRLILQFDALVAGTDCSPRLMPAQEERGGDDDHDRACDHADAEEDARIIFRVGRG